MNMDRIDWAIMLIAVVALRCFSMTTRKYMKGVADFLSANRAAGRYLLTIAGQMGSFGAISFIAVFQMHFSAGFPPLWWQIMYIPSGVIVLLTGWVYYRFRETRAMTMAQFFEMRYNRRFRIFAGILCWASGILNFGIFPAVTARFFICFCGLEPYYHLLGVSIATFPVLMAVNLALTLMFVNMGGQVSVMVTECVQGIFSCFAFIIIVVVVLVKLHWGQMVTALNMAPAHASMLHPFNTGEIPDFNVWYFLIAAVSGFYSYMSWQGTQGFNCAARSPHEQKMGGIIGIWRQLPLTLILVMLPIAAYSVLHLPEFSAIAAKSTSILNGIENPAVRNQMQVPVVLAQFLPIGVKGLLATMILFFSFTCQDTYLHSWGSIFIQDVVMPIRNKALSPEQHITWLRWSIIGVAIFSFIFSWIYPQSQKILMYMAITGTIWLGGSGACIIGGLYWRRGTTSAAYCALIVGAVFGSAGVIVPEIYKSVRHVKSFPVNGMYLMFAAMLMSMLVYVMVSLLTSRNDNVFNLDKLLNRGKYHQAADEILESRRPSKWMMIIGITEEFSPGDRFLVYAMFIWNFCWVAFFVVITAMNLMFHIGNDWWAKFWHFYVLLYLAISVPTTIWFTVGGIIDIKALFKALSAAERDHTDDGSVTYTLADESVSSSELVPVPQPAHETDAVQT